MLIVAAIIVQLYFTFQFAKLSYKIDHKETVSHPVAFESFPFVVYNMYSGKIDDWGKYSYLKIEADGQEVPLTDFYVNQEEQILNPTTKFIDLKAQDFNDVNLYSFLQNSVDSTSANKIYNKVSNQFLKNNPDTWGGWLMDYLSKLLGKNVHSVKIYSSVYGYNESGRPVPQEQTLVYQYSR